MATNVLSIAAALLLASSATAAIVPRADSTTSSVVASSTALVNSTACAPVHIIIARGTTETYPGSLEALAELVTEANPGTNYESVIYPATQETDTDSYAIGRIASRKQLTSYVRRCPRSQVVVLAYSQGVLVMGDAIAGGGGKGEALVVDANYTSALPPNIGGNIAAMVFYGDPRHMPNKPYDIYNTNVTGVSLNSGKYPRTLAQLRALRHYTPRLRDYCNIGDPVCASGDNFTAHLVYPQVWDKHAAAFIQSKLGW